MITTNNLIININGGNNTIYIEGEEYPQVNISPPKKYSPCDNCPNNPAVNSFASGVCNCALPYLYGSVTY